MSQGYSSTSRPASFPTMHVDLQRCIGCDACSLACKQENNLRTGIRWNRVYGAETGSYPSPDVRVLPMLCQQCGAAPCKAACDTLGNRALVRRPDGILYVDQSRCIGCRHCIAACQYRAIFFNPDTGKAEKCHFCMHRLDAGLLPACVITCMGITRDFGPYSEVAARHPQAEMMGRDVAILYENMGDAPPPRSGTAGLPAAPEECHR